MDDELCKSSIDQRVYFCNCMTWIESDSWLVTVIICEYCDGCHLVLQESANYDKFVYASTILQLS